MVNADDNFWALVIDGAIDHVTDGLPRRWRNIARMDMLDADEVADLAWAGFPATGRWPVTWRRPPFDAATDYLEGPRFSLGEGVVYADFTVRPIPRPDLDLFREIPTTVLGVSHE